MIIYKATSTVSRKSYIGLTADLHKRKTEHLSLANQKCQYHFHKAIRKYGFHAFTWDILEECVDRDTAGDCEIELIAKYDTFHNGYNGTRGGDGGFNGFHTEETKQKIREASLGNIPGNKGKKRHYNPDGSYSYR